MKNFINQVSRLRSQRGAVRFAVVCTLLATLAFIVLGMGYSRFSTRAHALPVAHQSGTGCGCSVSDVKDAKASADKSDPPLIGYWSPPIKSFSRDEIAALPTVLLLKAGTSLSISGLSLNKMSAKATWSATYGVVNATGKYTAPPYTPSRGNDILTLSDPSNVFTNGVQVHIHILPNPAIPGSAKTPYIKYSPAGTTTGPDIHVYYSHKLVLPPGMTSVPPQFLKNVPVVFDPEDLPAPSAPITSVSPVEVNTAFGQSVYIIPATDKFERVIGGLTLPVSTISVTLSEAKELPLYAGTPQTNSGMNLEADAVNQSNNLNNTPDPEIRKEPRKKCKDTKVHFIPLGTTESQSTQSDVILTITGGSKGAVDITPAFNYEIEVGVELPIRVTETTYVQTRTWDMVQCQNGKMKKVGQRICMNHDTVSSNAEPPFVNTFFLDVQKYSHYKYLGGLRGVIPGNYDGQPIYSPKTKRCNKTYLDPLQSDTTKAPDADS